MAISYSTPPLPRNKHLFHRDNLSLFASASQITPKKVNATHSLQLTVNLAIHWLIPDASAGADDDTTYNLKRTTRVTCTMGGKYNQILRSIEFIPLFLLSKTPQFDDFVGEAFRIHSYNPIRSFARKAVLSVRRGADENRARGRAPAGLELSFHAKVYPEGHEDLDRCKGWGLWGRYRDVPDKFEQKECAICLSEFGKNAEVSMMPCCHVFHAVCLTKCLKRNRRCPICRHSP